MTHRDHALYRYLTLWADFTPAEARDAVNSSLIHGFPSRARWMGAADESLICSMEQSKNRRAA
jgi:hypothetical protein